MGWKISMRFMTQQIGSAVSHSVKPSCGESHLFFTWQKWGVLMTRTLKTVEQLKVRKHIQILYSTIVWSISMPGGALFYLSPGEKGNLHGGDSLTGGFTLDNIQRYIQLLLNLMMKTTLRAIWLSGAPVRGNTVTTFASNWTWKPGVKPFWGIKTYSTVIGVTCTVFLQDADWWRGQVELTLS